MKTFKDSRNSVLLLGARGIAAMVVSALILLPASHSFGVVERSGTVLIGGKEVAYHQQGGQLSNTCNYAWWHGCSPTSAGMMMGHYDRNGYNSVPYDNLVPGGAAEQNTFGTPGALVNGIIASPGHISDFYSGGYGASGDDVSPPGHGFNCLADFMATSQDSAGNTNGSTKFYYFVDNSPLYESDIYSGGPYETSGMYGIGEYLEYAGYDASVLYNQYIFGYGSIAAGFTLAQYQAEINAGRPVMIHVEGHSMFGYGYSESSNEIYVFDTWDTDTDGQNPGTMLWGDAYPYGTGSLEHYGVTVLTPIPEPGTVLLLGLGALAFMRKRRAQ